MFVVAVLFVEELLLLLLLLLPTLALGDKEAEIGCWLGGSIMVVAGKGEDDLYFLLLCANNSPVGVLPPLRTDKSKGLS